MRKQISANRRSRRRERQRWTYALTSCCAAVVAGGAIGAAEPSEPAARCRLQTVSVATDVAMPTAATLLPSERPAAVVTSNYRRGPTGDWDVPASVDRDNPDVRGLLLTPSGPLLINLTILVDGEGFRAMRERWIDDALNSAQLDSAQPAGNGESTPTAGEDQAAAPDADLAVRRFRETDALTRLKKYASGSEISIGRDEARWLLAEWSPGPTLLELRPGFAADRARLAPLWVALDADGDGQLSAREVSTATSRLRSLDHDEDDFVTCSELTDSPVIESWASFPLFTALDASTDWTRLARQLRASFPKSPTAAPARLSRLLQQLGVADVAELTEANLSRLLDVDPILTIRIKLATTDAAETGVDLVQVAEGLLTSEDALSAAEDVVSLRQPDSVIEFSGAQPPAGKLEWSGQVAVGAVIDGSPLMRTIDVEGDHRLSLREVESVVPNVSRLDRNGDGVVSRDELPVPIRLTVTLGAHTHDVLQNAAVAAVSTRPKDSPPPPDWFAGMDVNRDGDLTLGEFLGTREQFDQMDADRNQRINTREAVDARLFEK